MRGLISSYILTTHTLLMLLLACLYVAYQAAYPYLNPAHLDWQDALIQAVLAILGLLIYGHLMATRIAGAVFNGSSTRHDLPVVPRQSRQG